MKDAVTALFLLISVATLFFLGIEWLANWRTWSEPSVWVLVLFLTFISTFRLGPSNRWIACFSLLSSIVLAVAFAIGLHDAFHLSWGASLASGAGILFGFLVLAQPEVGFSLWLMSQ